MQAELPHGTTVMKHHQESGVRSSSKPVEKLCPAHASSATDGTYMPVHITDPHVCDAQIIISQAQEASHQNSQLHCRDAHAAVLSSRH